MKKIETLLLLLTHIHNGLYLKYIGNGNNYLDLLFLLD